MKSTEQCGIGWMGLIELKMNNHDLAPPANQCSSAEVTHIEIRFFDGKP